MNSEHPFREAPPGQKWCRTPGIPQTSLLAPTAHPVWVFVPRVRTGIVTTTAGLSAEDFTARASPFPLPFETV